MRTIFKVLLLLAAGICHLNSTINPSEELITFVFARVYTFLVTEDCKVLSCVLRESSTSASVKVDIPAALETYNVRRHEDVIAVCTVSELGMGGGRSMRPGFIAQMMVTMTLNKTLGRLLPKVCGVCFILFDLFSPGK